MIERFSYSSLQTFNKCPAQFKIRYIDKVYKTDEGIEAFMGKRVHESIEYLYNTVLDGKLPFVDQIIEYHKEQWKKHWHDRIARVDNSMTPRKYLRVGEECIARYYRNHHPFDQPVFGNEVELDFFLDDSEQYQMKGFIDRLDHLGDGIWEIHDYKTSKRPMNQNQADKDEQLALYEYAFRKQQKDVTKVTLVWHFVRHGIKIRSSRSEAQLNTLVEKCKTSIDQIRDYIQNGGTFEPKTSMLCNWCYLWEECSAMDGVNPYIGRDN